MPVHVKLSEDQTHLIYEFEEPLEMSELMQAYEKEKEFRNAVPHTVHSIVDLSTIQRIPPNWLIAKAGPGLTHPRSGRMLFVGVSRGIQIIVGTILKIMRYDRMVFLESRKDADAFMAGLIRQSKRDDQSTNAS